MKPNPVKTNPQKWEEIKREAERLNADPYQSFYEWLMAHKTKKEKRKPDVAVSE